MTTWRPLADRAAETVQLAQTYFDDGAFRTAAERLRTAADLLDQAALIRSTEIGDSK